MRFTGALIHLDGRMQTALVYTQIHVIHDDKRSAELIERVRPVFGDVPVTLCAIRPNGTAAFRGPAPVVQALHRMPAWELPKRNYEFHEERSSASSSSLGRPTVGQMRREKEQAAKEAALAESQNPEESVPGNRSEVTAESDAADVPPATDGPSVDASSDPPSPTS